MDETLSSGPRDNKQYFKDKLERVLRFEPEIDGDDFYGYLDRVVDRLIELNEEIKSAFIKEKMPGVSNVRIKPTKMKGIEDDAYKEFGLPDLEEIIGSANNMQSVYNEARDFIDGAEVVLEFEAIPPDTDDEPRPHRPRGGSEPAPKIRPRLYTIALQLKNAGIQLDEMLNTVFSGRLEGTFRRLTPYKAFLVPQLNRIILECDSPRNKAYVFDLQMIAQVLGREESSELSYAERESLARNLLSKTKSELLGLISDNPGVGVGIDHFGNDWISGVTGALTGDLALPHELPPELLGYKNRPLDRNPNSATYGLFKTPEGLHFGPQMWIEKYMKDQLHGYFGQGAIRNAIKEGNLRAAYFLGLNNFGVQGWCVEEIYSHLTKNLEVLPCENVDNEEANAWRNFATWRAPYRPGEKPEIKHYGTKTTLAEKLSEHFKEGVGPLMVMSVAGILQLRPKQIRSRAGELPGYPFEDIAAFLEEPYTTALPLTSGPREGLIEIRKVGSVTHWGSPDRIKRNLGRNFGTIASAIERHKIPHKFLFASRGQGAKLVQMYCIEEVEQVLRKDLESSEVQQ